MGGLQWPDPPPEPVQEGEVVREPPEQGLHEVDVGLDETGDQQQPGEVLDGGGAGREVRSQGGDAAVADQDVAALDPPARP